MIDLLQAEVKKMNIRRIRESCNLTHHELAWLLGCATRSIYYWEGKGRPTRPLTVDLLRQLAQLNYHQAEVISAMVIRLAGRDDGVRMDVWRVVLCWNVSPDIRSQAPHSAALCTTG